MQNITSTNIIKNIGLVGAGISNLTLLHLLKKNPNIKMKITLFERSKVIGGRVATRKRENYFYDNGANYFDFKDKRIENLILNELPSDKLFQIEKPILLFNHKNEIFSNENLPDSNHEKIYNHFNSQVKNNNFTYSNGIRNLAELLIKYPKDIKNPDFSYDLKLSKNIFKIQSKFNFDENYKLNYKWDLISEDDEFLGHFDKIVFGTPSLNIARVIDKSDFSVMKKINFHDKTSSEKFKNFDKKEGELFENIKKDLSMCSYRKVYSMAIAYENLNSENFFKNEFFGLVNVDNKHLISTVFIENEKNREYLKNKNQIMLIVQFKENEITKKLNIENDKNFIYDMVKENLEKLIPQLKNKKIVYQDVKSWGFSFPDNIINENLLKALSERNIEIIGDSVCGIGKIDKAMLTAFDLYEKLMKF